jgi:hypothetical protein
MTTEKIYAGVQVALKQMTDRGWESDCCYVHPDQTAGPAVERQLAVKTYDCVVIGGGIRLPPKGLTHFEVIVNAIHKAVRLRPSPSTQDLKIVPMELADGWLQHGGPPQFAQSEQKLRQRSAALPHAAFAPPRACPLVGQARRFCDVRDSRPHQRPARD